MSDDWGSDTEEGFGDFAVPEVSVPDPPPQPAPAPASPQVNQWAAPSSGDARLATRLRRGAAAAAAGPPGSQDPRRGPPAPGFAAPRFAPPHTDPASATTMLYVSHLPSKISEAVVADFFHRAAVRASDVRITRHSDTNNVKAAFVTVRGHTNRDAALAMDGAKLSGRSVHVKIDGADRPGPASHAPGFSSPRHAASPSAQPTASGGPSVTLFCTYLPFNINEAELANFFGQAGVTPADIRITRHSDTNNVKAAFVTVRGDANRDIALAMDAVPLSGRPVRVKIDGSDRRGPSGHRERSGYGFGNRDRRGSEETHSMGATGGHRESGWSSGGWVDRSGLGSFDGGARGDRGRDTRGGPVIGRGGAEPRDDPTIPTGPPPAGRKKLVLKPRTKPPPVLEVDTRAIDGVKPRISSPALHSNDSAEKHGAEKADATEKPGASNKFGARQHSGLRKTPSAMRGEKWTNEKGGPAAQSQGEKWSTPREGAPRTNVEKWSNAKDGAPPRISGQTQSANKEEDAKKRPVLLNAFAALEVHDAEA